MIKNPNNTTSTCFRLCEKADIFNIFFASICTLADNASFLWYLANGTIRRINSFHVTENDILAIIKTLDPNKAHD